MTYARDISSSGSAQKVRGFRSMFGWRTANAILRLGNSSRINSSKRNGRRKPIRRGSIRCRGKVCSTAFTQFQRMNSNG